MTAMVLIFILPLQRIHSSGSSTATGAHRLLAATSNPSPRIGTSIWMGTACTAGRLGRQTGICCPTLAEFLARCLLPGLKLSPQAAVIPGDSPFSSIPSLTPQHLLLNWNTRLSRFVKPADSRERLRYLVPSDRIRVV